MSVTLIAAVASNGVIGLNNTLIWKLPADQAFFRAQTIGKPILMGRKTFESLGRPLKDRKNVVLSRSLEEAPAGCILVSSLKEAIERYANDDLMVIGGAEIYRQSLPFADRLLLTEIEESFEGDTYFPEFDRSEWTLISRVDGVRDERNTLKYAFCTYERASSI
jgi:dihydrofolate reductase